jgi:hypothetical protein
MQETPGQLATFLQPIHGNILFSKKGVLVSCGYCNEVLKPEWLRRTEMFCLTVLGTDV